MLHAQWYHTEEFRRLLEFANPTLLHGGFGNLMALPLRGIAYKHQLFK